MKKLTDTQKEYADLLKNFGYIIVTQGPVYATFVLHKKQMHSSSFEALVKNKLIRRISEYKNPKGLVISIWKYNNYT